MDTTHPLIYSRISQVMAAVGPIAKDRTNTGQGYKFRGIDDMYNALNQHLANAKIFCTSTILSAQREEKTLRSGSLSTTSILHIRWTLFAEDGSSVTTETIGEASDTGDKASNKSMSTAYKYALMEIFCIPTEDEKDTEHSSPEFISVRKQTPTKVPSAALPTERVTPAPTKAPTATQLANSHTTVEKPTEGEHALVQWYLEQTYKDNSGKLQSMMTALNRMSRTAVQQKIAELRLAYDAENNPTQLPEPATTASSNPATNV